MRVDQAEDGDVGADADGQRQQRADEESRLLREAAPGVNEVAKRSAHGGDHIKPDATNRAIQA